MPPWPPSDEQYDRHVAMLEERLAAARDGGMSTDLLYSVGGQGGVYTRERSDAQQEIITHRLGQAAGAPRERKAILAGGIAGAGKSKTLRDHAGINLSQWLVLNPDIVKNEMARRDMIPPVKGLSPMECACLVHDESKRVANLLADRAYAQMINVIWDVTMSSEEPARQRLGKLRDHEYRPVSGIFIEVPVDVARQRARHRHLSGQGEWHAGTGPGGRYIPADEIQKMAGYGPVSRCRMTFDGLRGDLDAWAVWDNGTDGAPPALIASDAL